MNEATVILVGILSAVVGGGGVAWFRLRHEISRIRTETELAQQELKAQPIALEGKAVGVIGVVNDDLRKEYDRLIVIVKELRKEVQTFREESSELKAKLEDSDRDKDLLAKAFIAQAEWYNNGGAPPPPRVVQEAVNKLKESHKENL